MRWAGGRCLIIRNRSIVSEPRKTAAMIVTALALLWPLWSASGQGANPGEIEDPKARFLQAENTFRFQDYQAAEAALYALLHPDVLLTDPDDVLKAREYLAACYYWLGNEKRMEEEFTALLIMAPNHRLDPFYYPADLIDRLDRLRDRLAELRIIHPQRSEEPRNEPPPCLVPKETVVKRSRWVSFIPFGVGQFQNGDTVKGALFLSGEILALGANVGSYVVAERLRGADGFYSPSNARTARTLRIVQYTSLGVLAGLMVWGVLDAALNIRTEDRSIEMVPCAPLAPPGEAPSTTGPVSRREGPLGPIAPTSPPTSWCVRLSWPIVNRPAATSR